jgi:hypothetical protein
LRCYIFYITPIFHPILPPIRPENLPAGKNHSSKFSKPILPGNASIPIPAQRFQIAGVSDARIFLFTTD